MGALDQIRRCCPVAGPPEVGDEQTRQPQVIVVTGASSGVGRAIARAFGARGARLSLIARNEDGLEAAAGEVRRAGGEALVLPLDVADADAVEAAAARVEAVSNRTMPEEAGAACPLQQP